MSPTTTNPNDSTYLNRVAIRALGSGPLRKGEDRELIALIRAGGARGAAAKERLLDGIGNYVGQQARKYAGRGVDVDDLYQQGLMGALRAIETYDPARDAFITYADDWIRKYILEAIEKDGSTTIYGSRLPRYQFVATGRVMTAVEELRVSLRREPTTQEIADRVKAPLAHVERALDVTSRRQTRLDAPVASDDGEMDFAEVVADDMADLPEHVLDVSEAQRALIAAWMELTDHERLVLCYRLGLGCEPQDIPSVSATTGLSYGAVQAATNRALRKLRYAPEVRELHEDGVNWALVLNETDFLSLTLKLNGCERDAPAYVRDDELDELEAMMASNGV